MNKIDLSGTWQLYMDYECKDCIPVSYNDEITLPNTTSNSKKGIKNDRRESGYLTEPYNFEGCAWYKKSIFIDSDICDKEVYLRLERTRMTTLYVDGEFIGRNNSLCASHIYKITGFNKGTHDIEICVKNKDYPTRGGHLTSPDTQTNWNGITGAIELIIRPAVHIDDVKITSDADNNSVIVECVSNGEGNAELSVIGYDKITSEITCGKNTIVYKSRNNLPLWDEYNHNILTLKISMNGEDIETPFGIRKIRTNGRKILVNDKEVFLRGKHDGMIFPMTGFAPTDVESWLDVMKTAKSFGINHYRFHTCCPPDAAFTAADMLGIYMQPELPFWGTIKDEIDEEQQYLIDEGYRILKEFGNHPSFVMMSLGNELWGSKDVLNSILAGYKKADDRHLYSDGSNNFQFVPCVLENSDFLSGVRLSHDRLYRGSYAMCDAPQGFIQTDVPNTSHNYDSIIVPEKLSEGTSGGKILIQYGTGVKEVDADGGEMFIPDVPVISHEVGQYETYPDFSEIERYTGTLKAENIALYKEKAEINGLLSYSEDFFRASGALAVDCYKREIEAALKTNELSGFQLLDIQDFTGQGTALVGVLNSLMQPKGTVTAEEWRCFCNDTVIMAEFDKFVFSSDEEVTFDITLFNTNPGFSADTVVCSISSGNDICMNKSISVSTNNRINKLGSMVFNADRIHEPKRYKLSLYVLNSDIHNEYEFTVYPYVDIDIYEDRICYGNKTVYIANDIDKAVDLNKSGEKAIYVPSAEGKLEGTYCTDFWCYPMFRSISESMNKPVPVGTMGCLIDDNSEIFDKFLTKSFSTPDWFEIIMHSHCENLDNTDIIPTVWMIDNPDRAQKLGIVYDLDVSDEKLLCITSRIWEIADKPEVKHFALDIVNYLYK